MKRIRFAGSLILCLALLCSVALAENPVVFSEGQQVTVSEESYFGTWAFDCAMNNSGEFAIDGISAKTYTLSIGPGWYLESIQGHSSVYPTIHAGSKLFCLYDDGSGAPAYFRLFLSEKGRLFTPMGSGNDAFTIYFTRVDDVPGETRGDEAEDGVVGQWRGTAPAGARLPNASEGVLTFLANGTASFENDANNCVGFWSREEAGIAVQWAHFQTDRFVESEDALVSEADGAVYTRK